MASWQVQDAKARFSELLETTLKKGPQVVTRRCVETAVLVPIEEWRRLQKDGKLDLKDWLLAPGPVFDEDFIRLLEKRPKFRLRRKLVKFD